jgi:hypothetical protein
MLLDARLKTCGSKTAEEGIGSFVNTVSWTKVKYKVGKVHFPSLSLGAQDKHVLTA